MKQLFYFAVFVSVVVGLTACDYTPRTADQLKVILQLPVSLFALMNLASFASALQQVIDSQKNGGTATIGSYLAKWPETIAVISGNLVAFAVLILTDQLNFASALGIGYGVNTAADLMRKGGRSATL